MTQRLLEGDVRAASIRGPEPSFRLRTQASNFSLCRRSPDSPDIATVSMPNWRKHSANRVREALLRSTKAARAAAFRGLMGGRTKAFSMSRGRLHFQNYCGLGEHHLKDPKDQRPNTEVQLDFWCDVKKDITSQKARGFRHLAGRS